MDQQQPQPDDEVEEEFISMQGVPSGETDGATKAAPNEFQADDDFISFDNNKNDNDNPLKDTTTKNSTTTSSTAISTTIADDTTTRTAKRQRPPFNLDQDLPPWMDRPPLLYVNPLVRLHNEIVQFTELVEPTLDEKQKRHDLVNRLRKLVARTFDDSDDPDDDDNNNNNKASTTKVEVFGSLATSLFLPSSDIDIVITTTTNKDDDEESSKKPSQESDLQRLANALREDWLPELSYLEVIENTRVPLVKFTHEPTSLNVDICFNQEGGVAAVRVISSFLKQLPPLKPLSFVLKYFLKIRGLNEPYSGGVGSFMLQLMVVAFLQQREREGREFQRPLPPNLGALLLELLEFYGCDFNFVTIGISVLHNGSFFSKGQRQDLFWKEDRPLAIAMENPLDTTMDVGSPSFRYSMIQRVFATSHKVLLAQLTAPELQGKSLLAAILPPYGDELWERQEAQQQQQREAVRKNTNNNKGNKRRPNGNRNGGPATIGDKRSRSRPRPRGGDRNNNNNNSQKNSKRRRSY